VEQVQPGVIFFCQVDGQCQSLVCMIGSVNGTKYVLEHYPLPRDSWIAAMLLAIGALSASMAETSMHVDGGITT
jgi:hypothetical protein